MADNKKSSIGGKTTCHLVNIKQPDRVAKRLKLSFQRTRATITLLKVNRAVDCSLSLLDVSESGLGTFTSELLLKGSTIEFCVTEPRLLKLKALVAWSIPVASGVQNRQFGFRSGLQFLFENEMQRSALLDFIQKVNTDPLELFKNPPAAPLTPAPASGLMDAAAPPADGAAPAEAAPVAEAPAADAVAAGEAPPVAEAPAGEAPVAEAAPVADAAAAPVAEAAPAAEAAATESGDGQSQAA